MGDAERKPQGRPRNSLKIQILVVKISILPIRGGPGGVPMGGHQGAEFPCRQSEITRRPSDRSVRPLFVEGGWGFFTDQVAIAFAYATPSRSRAR